MLSNRLPIITSFLWFVEQTKLCFTKLFFHPNFDQVCKDTPSQLQKEVILEKNNSYFLATTTKQKNKTKKTKLHIEPLRYAQVFQKIHDKWINKFQLDKTYN